jgi:hypothetical protein
MPETSCAFVRLHLFAFMTIHSLKLLFLPLVLAALPLQASMAKPSPKDSCTTAKLAGVAKVFPTDQSVQASVSSVGVNFRLPERIRSMKPLFRSFQLFVDGLDVTAKSQISATRDVPPSYIAIAYNSTISKEGNHQAKAQFRTKDGAIICYKWSFQVTPVKETPELNGTVLSPPSL